MTALKSSGGNKLTATESDRSQKVKAHLSIRVTYVLKLNSYYGTNTYFLQRVASR